MKCKYYSTMQPIAVATLACGGIYKYDIIPILVAKVKIWL